jgi:uncharacterized membrane protein YdjX (TVP38/TMEM64 family)
MSPQIAETLRGKTPSPLRYRTSRVLTFVFVAAVLVLLGATAAKWLPRVAQWMGGLGAWGPPLFIAVYAATTVLLVPGVILSLAGGAVFGLLSGALYVFAGAVLGASLAFSTSRWLLRPFVERWIVNTRRLLAIHRAVSTKGLPVAFLLRLSPVIPFNLLNYALGTTRIDFGDYLTASLGMIPSTFLYVYYGKVAGDIALMAGGVKPGQGPGYYELHAVGLVATILATMLVTRRARKALRAITKEDAVTREEATSKED